VFGFGFAPDGSVVAAACEKKSVLLYDPTSFKLISRHSDVHTDCVNCVKYLDSRLLATCSDDATVRLWDMRSMKKEVRTLVGHSSWVKNMDYSPLTGRLLTSGFDGNIFAWDINNYSESASSPEPLVHINGLVRTVLTPNLDTMVISTQGGYFIMVHNLDLDTLKEDMHGFKPHLYRIMQVLKVPVNNAMEFNYMFTRSKNRVEYFGDFPDDHTADSISSVEVHPQGWGIASRSTTLDETEWTCVHDIQSTSYKKTVSERLPSTHCSPKRKPPQTPPRPTQATSGAPTPPQPINPRPRNSPLPESRRLVWSLLDSAINAHSASRQDNDDSSEDGEYDPASDPYNELSDDDSMSEPGEQELEDEEMGRLRDILGAHDLRTQNSNDAYDDPLVNHEFEQWVSSMHQRFPENDIFNPEADQRMRNALFEEYLISQYRGTQLGGPLPDGQNIENMQQRLLFHIEEPNVGLGFIKEMSFSPNGRVLASPYANCVRLLGFNKSCHELCDCVPLTVVPLEEIATIGSMNSVVLSSTFSPTQPIVAAGCKDGTVAFCTPKF